MTNQEFEELLETKGMYAYCKMNVKKISALLLIGVSTISLFSQQSDTVIRAEDFLLPEDPGVVFTELYASESKKFQNLVKPHFSREGNDEPNKIVNKLFYSTPKITFGDQTRSFISPYDYSVIRTIDRRFQKDTLTTDILAGRYDGVFLHVEKDKFYTGNGFQYLPYTVDMIIVYQGYFERFFFGSYLLDDSHIDEQGVPRRVFSDFANFAASGNLRQIARRPEKGSNVVQTIPDRDVPSFTEQGILCLMNMITAKTIEMYPWITTLDPLNDTAVKRIVIPRTSEYGLIGPRDKNTPGTVLFKNDNTLIFTGHGYEYGGKKVQFDKIVDGVTDRTMRYAFEYVWNIAVDSDEKAGEYISQRARELSRGGEILRESIKKDAYKGVIIHK